MFWILIILGYQLIGTLNTQSMNRKACMDFEVYLGRICLMDSFSVNYKYIAFVEDA